MFVIFCLPKRIFLVLTHLCGGLPLSAFVLSDSHFCRPCVGAFFLILDQLGMRQDSLWGVH